MNHEYSIIVAKNEQNGIGYDNNLLFQIKKDMTHFMHITQSTSNSDLLNGVVMGYNTWDSIPLKFKPLKSRLNIIITQNHYEELIIKKEEMGWNDREVIIFNSLENIKEKLNSIDYIENIFIIGGYKIYSYFLEYGIDKLYITNIKYSLPKDKIDTYFPGIDYNDFEIIFESGKLNDNGKIIPLDKNESLDFEFKTYKKNFTSNI